MKTLPASLLAILIAGTGAQAATCGSSLMAERSAPVVFQNVQLGGGSVARYWQAGGASQAFNATGCAVGCVNSGSGIALIGVDWINGSSCATAGFLPTRTIFVVESATTSSGGIWAAFNLDRNALDANLDLDAKASAVCGGCASTAAPHLGGGGVPVVSGPMVSAGNLTATLTWSAPSSTTQALSNGVNVVTSYAVYFKRSVGGAPPPNTGDKTGWTFAPDGDGTSLGGYSTNGSATVSVPLGGSSENVYFAIGSNFDGSGNPDANPDTIPSTYISAQSAGVDICALGDAAAPQVAPPAPSVVPQTLCQ